MIKRNTHTTGYAVVVTEVKDLIAIICNYQVALDLNQNPRAAKTKTLGDRVVAWPQPSHVEWPIRSLDWPRNRFGGYENV